MAKLYDEEGNEVEAFTPEEVEAQKKAVAEAEAAKIADKEKNFEALRLEKEAAEKKAAETAEILAKKEQETVEAERNKAIDAIAEGNKDLKDKINLHIQQRTAEIKTSEDFKRILSDAYTVSAGHVVPDKLNNVISSAGASGGSGTAPKLPISPEALPVANKLGISEADLKEYGDQL